MRSRRSRRPDRHHAAGGGAILIDLRLQRVETVELAFRPQILDQGNPQRFAVQIAVEIEKMHLEQQTVAAVWAGAPEVRDAATKLLAVAPSRDALAESPVQSKRLPGTIDNLDIVP